MVTLPDIDLEYLKIPQYLYEKIHHDGILILFFTQAH